MSGEEFAAIEARANAATPGPWAGYEDETSGERYLGLFYDGGNVQPITEWTGDQEDAEFIAHARTDIPRLLAAVRERDNTIARVRALIESAPHLHDPWADDWKGEQVVPVDRIRAALDPQETP